MGVNSLPETVTRQRRDCDLNPGPSAPESSTLTNRLPSHPSHLGSPGQRAVKRVCVCVYVCYVNVTLCINYFLTDLLTA